MDNKRDETIRQIRTALRLRSGKPWSVTGGRGTAWGWITIDAPPKRRTAHSVKIDPNGSDFPDNYTSKDTGEIGGSMTDADRKELADLLGLSEPVHYQGVSIPASYDYYQEYMDRAEGRPVSVIGKPYWD